MSVNFDGSAYGPNDRILDVHPGPPVNAGGSLMDFSASFARRALLVLGEFESWCHIQTIRRSKTCL